MLFLRLNSPLYLKAESPAIFRMSLLTLRQEVKKDVPDIDPLNLIQLRVRLIYSENFYQSWRRSEGNDNHEAKGQELRIIAHGD